MGRAKPWGATRSMAGRSPFGGSCPAPSGGLLMLLIHSALKVVLRARGLNKD